MVIKRRDFFKIFSNKKLSFKEQIESCLNLIQAHHGQALNELGREKVVKQLTSLKNYLYKKIQECSGRINIAEQKNREYFDSDFVVEQECFDISENNIFTAENLLDKYDFQESSSSQEDIEPPQLSSEVGTKRKSFEDLGKRQQDRRVKTAVIEIHELNKSCLALLKQARQQAREEKKFTLEKILERLITKYEEGKFNTENDQETIDENLDPDIAVGMIAYTGMSQQNYGDARAILKNAASDVLPIYSEVLKAKKRCYPQNIKVEDLKATIPLENIVETTTCRIFDAHSKEISAKIDNLFDASEKNIKVKMIGTWGLDGSGSHSIYNQKSSETEEIVKDDTLISVTMSVHELRHENSRGNIFTLWENDKSQSVFSVRPFQLHFAKETDNFVRTITKDVRNQIANLKPMKFKCDEKVLEITFDFYQTMIDGKVFKIISNTSSYKVCQICGAKPKSMNKIQKLRDNGFKPKTEMLKFNLQPLHTTMLACKFLLNYHSFREF